MKQQIKELSKNELIITKSKFITFLFPVNSLDEIKDKLKEFNEKYYDSTHICYSYILDENTFKYYDDGEPGSTAGAPIYQVLKNNNLVYSMCVVIRYFGGTKLGVGGLIKAYTNSALECLNKSTVIPYEKLEVFTLKTSYSNYDKLDYYLRTNNITVLEKQFDESVIIKVNLNKKNLELIQDSFQNTLTITKL